MDLSNYQTNKPWHNIKLFKCNTIEYNILKFFELSSVIIQHVQSGLLMLCG